MDPFFEVHMMDKGCSEFFYINAHTWVDARAIARILYPAEHHEPTWRQMKIQHEVPPYGATIYWKNSLGDIVETQDPWCRPDPVKKKTKKSRK